MTPAGALVVGTAAFVASAINAGAGGGSFLSFPALLSLGIAPISANATNNTAMWLGSLSSTGILRSEIDVPRRTLVRMALVSTAGSMLGAIVLLRTSNGAFSRLIPLLLFVASSVYVAGPRLSTAARAVGLGRALAVDSPLGLITQFSIAIYGGFFGAAIGILMLAMLGVLGLTDARRANAFKVLLATVVNGVAVIPFVAARAIAWEPAAVASACAIGGGFFGAALVRRVPPQAVRRFVIVVAWSTTIYFAITTYGPHH